MLKVSDTAGIEGNLGEGNDSPLLRQNRPGRQQD
jgi:hypothetical protein